jgi:hypothetical protein
MCPTYRIFLNIEKKGRKILSELSQIRLIECPTYRVSDLSSVRLIECPTYRVSDLSRVPMYIQIIM